MSGRRGAVPPVRQHSDPSAHVRGDDRLRRGQHPGACMNSLAPVMDARTFETIIRQERGAGRFFADTKPIVISRAPGRLDLMGGNVDYTGGLVFQATIREATWAAVQLRDDRRVGFWNPPVAAD